MIGRRNAVRRGPEASRATECRRAGRQRGMHAGIIGIIVLRL
jgi:hypothetical protein